MQRSGAATQPKPSAVEMVRADKAVRAPLVAASAALGLSVQLWFRSHSDVVRSGNCLKKSEILLGNPTSEA
jgi:hypothetical protein